MEKNYFVLHPLHDLALLGLITNEPLATGETLMCVQSINLLTLLSIYMSIDISFYPSQTWS